MSMVPLFPRSSVTSRKLDESFLISMNVSVGGVYNIVTIFFNPIAMAVSLAPAVSLKHCQKLT